MSKGLTEAQKRVLRKVQIGEFVCDPRTGRKAVDLRTLNSLWTRGLIAYDSGSNTYHVVTSQADDA